MDPHTVRNAVDISLSGNATNVGNASQVPFSSIVFKSFRNRVTRFEDLWAKFKPPEGFPAVGSAERVWNTMMMCVVRLTNSNADSKLLSKGREVFDLERGGRCAHIPRVLRYHYYKTL